MQPPLPSFEVASCAVGWAVGRLRTPDMLRMCDAVCVLCGRLIRFGRHILTESGHSQPRSRHRTTGSGWLVGALIPRQWSTRETKPLPLVVGSSRRARRS